MARFTFKLAGVLRQREQVEDLRHRELAAAQAQVARLDGELRALDGTVRGATQDMRDNRLVGRLDMAYIAAHRRFTVAMQRRAVELAQRIAAAQQAVDKARAALVEATKQRKVLEKLRHRQHERWRAEVAMRETAALDEVGMQIAQMDAADAGALVGEEERPASVHERT